MKNTYKTILWFIPFLLISCHKDQKTRGVEEDQIHSKEYIENRSEKDFKGGALQLDCLPHYSAVNRYKKHCEKISKDCALAACQKSPQGGCTFDPKAFKEHFAPLCAKHSGAHPQTSLEQCQKQEKYGPYAVCIGGYRATK